jgi:Do/DeqQ family serine protease
MTDETLTMSPRRSRFQLGASLTLAASIAAGAAGFATGRVAAEPTHEAQPTVTRAASSPMTARLGATASYSDVVERVAPAVVTVRVERRVAPMDTSLPPQLRDFFGEQMPRGMQPAPPRRASGLGSGVVLRADGYIATNAHVVGDAERVQVEFHDRRTLSATVVGLDEASDLAVLKVDATDLPTVPLGDTSGVRVGDVVLALGNPLGVGQTVTMGIVSAKGRTTGLGADSYEDFIQTDAPINQGNSGGALVNLSGELVGINSQILSRSGGNIGLGFAIPAEMVRSVTDQLISDGVVRRSQLGVVVQGLTADLAAGLGLDEPRGALVSDVTPDSPAARSGLKAGDVITAIDGRAVIDGNALRNQVASTTPGSTVTLDVMREGETRQVTAELVAQPSRVKSRASAATEGDAGDARLGVAVSPVTPELRARLGLPQSSTGLVVTNVDPAGPAAEAGLQEGDVITSANGTSVADVDTLRGALASRTGRPAVLTVTREGRSLFVAVPERS